MTKRTVEAWFRYRSLRAAEPTRSGRAWFAAVCLAGLGWGCASTTAQPRSQVNAPVAEAEPQRLAISARPLRPLTADEHTLEQQLRNDVAELVSAGERHTGNEWGLAVATDNLASRLEGMGLAVDREGFVSEDGALAQNLIVTLRGDTAPSEVVLVGARFDSAQGSVGADDNASGVATLLELARRYKDAPHARTLRLIWFSDSSNRQRPEGMGAWEHLEHLGRPRLVGGEQPESEAKPAPLVACVEVHGLGVYSEALGSQRYAEGMPQGHPIGEFVEVVAMAQHTTLGETLASAMGRTSSIPIKSVTALEPEADAKMTAFRAYVEHACPAVLVSDTQRRRFSGFGTKEDTVERLDFARLARAVTALGDGIGVLLNLSSPDERAAGEAAPPSVAAGAPKSPGESTPPAASLGSSAPAPSAAAPL